MRTTVVTVGFFALIVGTSGRLESQAAAAAASEIVKIGTGALKKSEKDKKNAEKNKKPAEKEKEKPKFDPTLCSTSPDAYAKMIQAVRLEIAAREAMKDDIAKSKVDQRKFQQCQADVAQSGEFQKIMNRNPPTANTTPQQFAQNVQKNSEDAQQVMDQKCGEDPTAFWTKKNRDTLLDYLEMRSAQSEGLSQGCYAVLKEYADYFCNLPEATQEKAVKEGIAIKGGGKAFWVFTPQHASAIKPNCERFKLLKDDLDRAKPR